MLGCLPAAVCLAQPPAASEAINITVDKGFLETTHRTNTKYAAPMLVTVTDWAGRPIAGADVNVTSPSNGAGIVFLDGSGSAQVKTGEDGVAKLVGLKANGAAGPFNLRITASFGGVVASQEPKLNNERPPALTRKRLTLAAVGAAAVVIPVLALRKTPPPTATVTAVTPTGPVTNP